MSLIYDAHEPSKRQDNLFHFLEPTTVTLVTIGYDWPRVGADELFGYHPRSRRFKLIECTGSITHYPQITIAFLGVIGQGVSSR